MKVKKDDESFTEMLLRKLQKSLPSVFTRREVQKLLGGAISPGTLANLGNDGPEYIILKRMLFMKRTAFLNGYVLGLSNKEYVRMENKKLQDTTGYLPASSTDCKPSLEQNDHFYPEVEVLPASDKSELPEPIGPAMLFLGGMLTEKNCPEQYKKYVEGLRSLLRNTDDEIVLLEGRFILPLVNHK